MFAAATHMVVMYYGEYETYKKYTAMNSYRIEDNEIKIAFDGIPHEDVRKRMKENRFRWDPSSKIWHTPFTDERAELARELTEDLQMQHPKVPGALVGYIDSILTSEDEDAKIHITSLLTDNVASELDAYVQAIRDYKNEEKQAALEKRQQEAVIKAAVSEITAKKKLAVERRKLLESIIRDYILSTGEARLKGRHYNVSFTESSSFSISEELKEDIRRKAGIPDWISLEFKINQDAFRQLDGIPQGVVESRSYKIRTWTNEEGDPDMKSHEISLAQFSEGKTIREIAEGRNLRWKTIYSHLRTAMDEGQLDIHDHVSEDILNRLKMLAPHGREWTIKEYHNALQKAISYDHTALALAYLKIRSAD